MPAQTYASHAHRPTMWLIAWFAAMIATTLLLLVAGRGPSLQSIALVVLGLATILAVTLIRLFALRLQDRIIRLEMQVRLARLGREHAFPRLSVKQLVALRFASDAELPALIDRTAAEKLSPDQIKRAVTDWQADDLRT